MSVRAIARALGGDIVGPGRIAAPGPGHSRVDRSMSILIDPAAPRRLCRQQLHRRRLARVPRPCPANSRDRSRRTRGRVPHPPALRRIHARRLLRGCGRKVLRLAGRSPKRIFLGVGSSCNRKRSMGARSATTELSLSMLAGEVARLPAMIAAMVDIRTNEFRGIHRTALAATARARPVAGLGNPKRMLGPAAGACVKLSPDEDVSNGLHIAEGIETALACMAMGFQPMWAAMSASGIAKFPVLAGIDALTVFADHDATGMAAAADCARRWDSAARDVTSIIPALAGTDFADGQRP